MTSPSATHSRRQDLGWAISPLTRRVALLMVVVQVGLAVGSEPLHRLYHRFQAIAETDCGGCCCQQTPKSDTAPEGCLSAPRPTLHCFSSDCRMVQLFKQQRILAVSVTICELLDARVELVADESHVPFLNPIYRKQAPRGPPQLFYRA